MNRAGLLIGLGLLGLSGAEAADSHCSATEQTIFSCKLGRKAVSICASTGQQPQYRFGALGAPELSLPKSSSDRVYARTLMFSGGGGAYMRFNHGTTSYIVYSAIGKGWGNKDGVAVEQNGKTVRHLDCQNVPVSQLGAEFFSQAGLTEDSREFELPL